MSNKGFILVLTLWLLAILTIAASFFALWTERLIEQTRIAQQNMQGEIDMASTQSNILYLFATQRYTFAGLLIPTAINPQPMSFMSDEEFARMLEDPNFHGGSGQQFTYTPGGEIHLDDRVYQGHGSGRFAVQDEGGLINLNSASEAMLSRLMGLLGIDAEWRSPLVAKLQDYTDFDDLHHINGAEAYEYQQENLPPPQSPTHYAVGSTKRDGLEKISQLVERWHFGTTYLCELLWITPGKYRAQFGITSRLWL
ncbi:MAG: type II secretion system protein GspK [Thiotrichaceae bacterium]